jgi:hypothetical protein
MCHKVAEITGYSQDFLLGTPELAVMQTEDTVTADEQR